MNLSIIFGSCINLGTLNVSQNQSKFQMSGSGRLRQLRAWPSLFATKKHNLLILYRRVEGLKLFVGLEARLE